VRLLADPPPGASMTLSARDDEGAGTGVQKLTPPVESTSFSLGTLGLAVAVALFAGGFMGNLLTSRRRRPAARPSIYGAVQRRLDTQKSSS
jgi:hypothetical protein